MQLSDMGIIETSRPAARSLLRVRPSPAQQRPRRGPRAEEIALMRGLAAGPKSVTSGPIGRCVKRDWCRAVVEESGEGAERRATVRFFLTEMGRALIA